MDKFKIFFLKHLEKFIVLVILISLLIINYFVLYRYKLLFLNFFYLPVLLAGYYSGKRMAILTSIFSVSAVILLALFSPSSFMGEEVLTFDLAINLTTWASFLILVGVMIGVLYEEKERKIKELKDASLIILEILSKYLTSLERFQEENSFKVANLSAEIASNLQLSRSEIENIRIAGFLHEFGKTKGNLELLEKTTKLISKERESGQYYSEKEAIIIQALDEVLKEAIPIISAYHEYYSTGNKNLREELQKIPLGASIIAISEYYYNLTKEKPDAPAKSEEEAKILIEKSSGVLFPFEVVEAFKKTTLFYKTIH